MTNALNPKYDTRQFLFPKHLKMIRSWTWPLISLALFVLIILPTLNLSVDSVAYGDHASNSILVYKAKSLSLLHGNYSRVGFYHPGPYFFYVMAVGEILFHDLIPLSSSPEGAHRLAIAISNLVLLGLIFRQLNSHSGRLAVSAISVLFGLAIMLDQAPVLFSIWPPHMYVIPAFLFTVGTWFLIRGSSSALPLVALGGGILVHGHASNLGLIPLMLIGVIISTIAVRRLNGDVISAKALYVWIKPSLVATVTIFIIFLLPFMLQTILNWPGEVPKYFAQSGGTTHGLFAATDYTFAYWQGWAWLIIIGFLAMILFRHLASGTHDQDKQSSRVAVDILATFSTFVITMLAIIFYAVKGIDDLGFAYIGIWYLGSVAALLTICSVTTLTTLRNGAKLLSATLIALLAFLNLTYFDAPKQNADLNNDGASVDEILKALETRSDNSQATIMIDNRRDWTILWPSLIGVMNRSIRTSVADICIAPENWHILFHDRGKCHPDRMLVSREKGTLYIASTSQLPSDAFEEITTFEGLHAYKTVKLFRPRPSNFSDIDLADPSDFMSARLILASGWTSHTGPFVWQTNETAILTMTIPPTTSDITLLMNVISQIPAEQTPRIVKLNLDGQTIAEFELGIDQTEFVLESVIPSSALPRTGQLRITVNALYAPSEWSDSIDARPLGLGLRSVTLRPNP